MQSLGKDCYISSNKSKTKLFNILVVAIATSCVNFVSEQVVFASDISSVDETQRDYFDISEDGNFTYQLEKLNLDSIKFKEIAESGDNVLEIGNDYDLRHYAYTYTTPENYTKATERVSNLSSSIEDVVYENFSTSSHGAAIHYTGNGSYNITADFINNHVSGGYSLAGGAIYNQYGTSKLGQISGNFIGNYVDAENAAGAAIRNDGIVASIQGNFINNHTNSLMGGGGTIYNAHQIGKIKANFIGNYAIAGSMYSYGAGIYNQGNIDELTGDFISNKISSRQDKTYGGAIWSPGDINKLSANFIYNSASAYRDSFGGAIYNNGGTFNQLTANFIGNSAISTYSSALGGAINLTNGTINLINSRFLNNYVEGYRNAKGGAIWTNKNLNIIADNGTSIIKDNYIQNSSGEKQNQAIWIDNSSATLTFNAKNDGLITLNDYVEGVSGYGVNLTGDATGRIKLYNDLKYANVTSDTVIVDTADGAISITMNSTNLHLTETACTKSI